MFKAIKKTLVDSSPIPKKFIIYSNICSRVMDLQPKIGDYLDADDEINKHEVIVVHGNFSKVEKSRYTQFFINPDHPDDVNINVICATSGVVHANLDSPQFRNVSRMEFPPPPLDFVQEIDSSVRIIPPDPIN